MLKDKNSVLNRIESIIGGFEEDDKKIFKAISNLAPDFNIYVNNFYLDFKTSVKELDKYAIYTLTAFSEFERLLKNKNKYNTEILSLNAIVLIYGYAMLLNQALDSGIISKELNKEIKEYAIRKKISEFDALSILDANTPPSLEVKRYRKGVEILLNPKIKEEVEKLKKYNLFNDSDMEGLENKLYMEIRKGYLITSREFNSFLKFFKKNEYFPLLSAIEMLVQIIDHPGSVSVDDKQTKIDDIDLKSLIEIYAKAKIYKDITGVEIRNKVLMLYFELLKEIANKKQMNLYSPIRAFVEQLQDYYGDFVILYNLNNKRGAYEKLKEWYSILEGE